MSVLVSPLRRFLRPTVTTARTLHSALVSQSLPCFSSNISTASINRSCSFLGLHGGSGQFRTSRKNLGSKILPSTASFPCHGVDQRRSVHVEVKDDNLDRALKKLKWKLRDSMSIPVARARQYYYKPSDLKILRQKERDIRKRKKEFKEKLNWVMSKRSRGF
eukprot:TRINITY_DN2704_c0_g1_i4.p1 TRINITY_DN2704_c0_g1~~TRINITY_DN2704_c0_g1_i4.p1  ORF type:complete len:173 (+),score=28.16 TRINITY_DN2704_c0_g1_i4:34-519(+)